MTIDISRFVTDTDPAAQFFALYGLPEEVIAVLFAYYARSPDDLRTNLRRLLADGELALSGLGGADAWGGAERLDDMRAAAEKARAFHEKWTVGYGHGSVAEHAVVRLAAERVSILAAKAIEDGRLASYTEKSTRAVRLSRAALVTDVGLSPLGQKAYLRGAYALLDRYESMVERLTAQLAEREPGRPERERAARVFDLLRGLLPAGVGTNVGVTVNGRSAASMIRKLAASELTECVRVADGFLKSAKPVMPALLKYVEPSEYRMGAADRVLDAMGYEPGPTRAVDCRTPPHGAFGPSSQGVRLLECEGIDPVILAKRIVRELQLFVDPPSSREGALAVVHAYLSDRGKWDNPGRALERAVFTFRRKCDYGAWRDLQRQRLVSATQPLLTARADYACPAGLEEFGMADEFCEAVEAAADAYEDVLASDGPQFAQYVVPLARMVEWDVTMNLREVFHEVELRSGQQGHPAYRAVAIETADAVIEVAPFVEPHLRVDRENYVWAREPKSAFRGAAKS